MSKVRTYTRNLIANWTAYGVNVAPTLAHSGLVFLLWGSIRRSVLHRADRGREFRRLTRGSGLRNER
jgi:hypothetical protein